MAQERLLSKDHELHEIASAPKSAPTSSVSSIIQTSVRDDFPRKKSLTEESPSSGRLSSHAQDILGWPTTPRSLRKTGWSWWSAILVDVLMVMSPLPFLVLAIFLAASNGKRTEDRDRWDGFQNSIKIDTDVMWAATLFPIAFATLAGRATTKIAAYHLEHGVALGKLEQLSGSRTLGSTITTQYRLGSYNALGLGLLILWSISPIGGQAVQRVLSTGIDFEAAPTTFPYFDTDTKSQVAVNYAASADSAPAASAWYTKIASLYTTSLLTTANFKDTSMDLWGNVKIPFMSSYSSSKDSSWSKPQGNNSSLIYSSLTGIPISALPLGTTNFSIESSYVEMSCQNISFRSHEIDLLKGFDFDELSWELSAPNNGSYRGTNWTSDDPSTTKIQATWSLGLDTFVSSAFSGINSGLNDQEQYLGSPAELPQLSNDQASIGTLFFQAIDPSDAAPRVLPTSSTAAYCKLQQVYVESNITCQQNATMPSRLCSVTAQRLSQRPHQLSAITPLSFPKVFTAISSYLPRAFQVDPAGGSSDPSVFYLNNTSPTLLTSKQVAIVYNVPPETLSYRLAQLINTYLLITQTDGTTTEGTPSDFFSLGLSNSTTTGITTTPFEVYAISWSWLAIFVFATVVLFACAIIAMVYNMASVNPEVLGACSSMIRDSRYFNVPVGGGTLDGLEMTRLLREVRVRMGDVGDDRDGVTHLAVARAEDVSKTVKAKFYA